MKRGVGGGGGGWIICRLEIASFYDRGNPYNDEGLSPHTIGYWYSCTGKGGGGADNKLCRLKKNKY